MPEQKPSIKSTTEKRNQIPKMSDTNNQKMEIDDTKKYWYTLPGTSIENIPITGAGLKETAKNLKVDIDKLLPREMNLKFVESQREFYNKK